jgi:hypothetical protein
VNDGRLVLAIWTDANDPRIGALPLRAGSRGGKPRPATERPRDLALESAAGDVSERLANFIENPETLCTFACVTGCATMAAPFARSTRYWGCK